MRSDYFPNISNFSVADLKDSVVMSNSQGLDWTQCERRHHYKHVLKLDPVTEGFAQRRGTLGHEALAEYYSAIREGKSKDKCYQAAISVIDKALIEAQLSQDYDIIQIIIHLKSLITSYINRHYDDGIIVHEVESIHILPTPILGVQYGMKLDVLIEWTKPPVKGDLEIWDHKFPYNFRSQPMQRLNPQLPRYIAALRSKGLPVVRGRLNQIRYRPMKNPTANSLFQRLPYNPVEQELDLAVTELFETMKRIKERMALDIDTQERMALRVRSQSICEKCPAQRLCIADLEGGVGSAYAKTIAKQYYRRSTYGYSIDSVGSVDSVGSIGTEAYDFDDVTEITED